MEAALQTIGNFCNIRHMSVLWYFIVILWELEVHFLGEEKLQEEVHDLRVFLLIEVVICEHGDTATHYELASGFLVLVDCANGPIAWICQRPRCKNCVRRWCYGQTSTIDIHEIHSSSLGFLLILLLIVLPSSQHESIIASAFGLLGIAISNSSDFFIQDAVMDVGFLRMEVFIERCADYAIRVYDDSELFGDFWDVAVVSK